MPASQNKKRTERERDCGGLTKKEGGLSKSMGCVKCPFSSEAQCADAGTAVGFHLR